MIVAKRLDHAQPRVGHEHRNVDVIFQVVAEEVESGLAGEAALLGIELLENQADQPSVPRRIVGGLRPQARGIPARHQSKAHDFPRCAFI